MKKGKDLLEDISKGLLILVFAVLIIGLFIPEGKGLPVMFGGVLLFFLYPIIEQMLILYHKWVYRNIIVGDGYLDEESDLWERFLIRILKVIPFEELPQVLHESYKNNIETYYNELIRDKSLDEVNKRFTVNPQTLGITPTKPINYEELKQIENKQKPIEDYEEEDEEYDGS